MESHPMHGHAMMSMPLLPWWLRICWGIALLAVAVLHIRHAWTRPGQHRGWHLGHTVMALGMAAMYLLPDMGQGSMAGAAQVLYGALALAIAASALLYWYRERALNPLWVLSCLDMLAMLYMFLPHASRPVALTWVLIGYLGVQAVAWLGGFWRYLPLYRPTGTVPDVASSAGEAVATSGVTQVVAEPSPAARAGRVELSGHVSLGVRITLAVMAAGMAYMLAAM